MSADSPPEHRLSLSERLARRRERHLERSRAAKRSAANASPLQKALGIGATAVGIAAFVVAAILWDVPLLPVV